jgi:hypothetical protein
MPATTKTAALAEKTFAAQDDATEWVYLGPRDPLSVKITGTLSAGTVVELQHSFDQTTVQTIRTYTASDVFDYEAEMPPGHYRLICTTYVAAGTPAGALWN